MGKASADRGDHESLFSMIFISAMLVATQASSDGRANYDRTIDIQDQRDRS